jgi:hypothetical protein
LLVQLNPAVVLLLGDNQYEAGGPSDFQTYYDPTWGRVKALTRPSVGNHEYLTSGAAGYFDYFNGVGNQSGPAGDRTKGYYSFNVGAWHLIALNTSCSGVVGGCGVGSPEETWLRQDLAANPTACTLAYFHHPRYSSGQQPLASGVLPLFQDLYDGNADLVLSGHDHDYERFAPQDPQGNVDLARGIRQFVAGTGGRNNTSVGSGGIIAHSEVVNFTSFGVLKLTLHATSYTWQFLPIAGQTFTDSGTQACH